MLLQIKILFVLHAIFTVVSSRRKQTTELQQLISAYGTVYCPHTDLCQSNASQPLNDDSVAPCCDACSCADDCWKKDNCCLDKHRSTSRAPIIECQKTLVKGTSKYQYFNTFWVVTKCPETTTNSTMLKKCKGKQAMSLNDYLWVSDPISNQIYNNKWCAVCHGINETVEWRVGTECVDMMQGNFDFNDIIGSDDCNLIVIPPQNIDVDTIICSKPDISFCNETGSWRTYDKSINQACRALKQPFTVESFVGKTVYRNVFCAICNEERYEQFGFENVCEPHDAAGRGQGGTYLGLINWRFYKQVEDENSKCAMDEVEDELLGVCRSLTCPMLTAPFYGTCKRAIEKTVSLPIHMLYRIELLWRRSGDKLSDMKNFDSILFSKKVIKTFEHDSGLASKGCVSCHNTIWTSSEADKTLMIDHNLTLPSYFLVHLKYITGGSCDHDIIANGMKTLIGTDMQVKMSKDVSVEFSVAPERQSLDDMVITNIQIFGTVGSACPISETGIYLSQSQLCPVITLTDADYIKLRDTLTVRKRVNALFGVEESDAFAPDKVRNVTVCLDDYRAMFLKESLNAATVAELQLIVPYVISAAILLLSPFM